MHSFCVRTENQMIINLPIKAVYGYLPVVTLCLFLLFFRLGVSPIPWFMTPEVRWPDHIRACRLCSSYILDAKFWLRQLFLVLLSRLYRLKRKNGFRRSSSALPGARRSSFRNFFYCLSKYADKWPSTRFSSWCASLGASTQRCSYRRRKIKAERKFNEKWVRLSCPATDCEVGYCALSRYWSDYTRTFVGQNLRDLKMWNSCRGSRLILSCIHIARFYFVN